MRDESSLPFRLEIHWVKKTNRFEVHDRIYTVGGTTSDGVEWQLSQRQVADAIDAGTHSFCVRHAGAILEVVSATSRWGFRYIKTIADESQPDLLLELAKP